MTASASQRLAVGSDFTNVAGTRKGVITGFLGAGGQGSVYEVNVGGSRFALKWYHDSYIDIDLGLRTRLQKAVERGAPNASFLWPLDLVEMRGEKSFGYIMPVRRGEYRGLRDLIARPPDRVELTMVQRYTLCARLAEAFLQLHAAGLCYQDVNFGNIFFHPQSVDALICDNDNVNVDGADASIYGTRKFMAPEVVRRETLPNTKTDLFSMSVLFFYAVMGWHPLDGKREAEYSILNSEAELSLYGEAPLFLFDPENTANGPVEGLHDPLVARWQSLPKALRRLFTRAFTSGLNDPDTRVLERQWRSAFSAAVPSVFPCQDCGFEHSIDAGAEVKAPQTCQNCQQDLSAPLCLSATRGVLALSPGQALPQHLLTNSKPSFKALVGLVEEHPSKPGVIGLRNVSDDDWVVHLPDREPGILSPGTVIIVQDGARFKFGDIEGRVVRPSRLSATAPQAVS